LSGHRGVGKTSVLNAIAGAKLITGQMAMAKGSKPRTENNTSSFEEDVTVFKWQRWSDLFIRLGACFLRTSQVQKSTIREGQIFRPVLSTSLVSEARGICVENVLEDESIKLTGKGYVSE